MIAIGSQDHYNLVSHSAYGWMERKFVRNGDDWNADDKWQPTWNAAARLVSMAMDMLLTAKVIHYFGDDNPDHVKIEAEMTAVLEAEKEAEKERKAREQLAERVLSTTHPSGPTPSPAWDMAMADRYGGSYETKAQAILNGPVTP